MNNWFATFPSRHSKKIEELEIWDLTSTSVARDNRQLRDSVFTISTWNPHPLETASSFDQCTADSCFWSMYVSWSLAPLILAFTVEVADTSRVVGASVICGWQSLTFNVYWNEVRRNYWKRFTTWPRPSCCRFRVLHDTANPEDNGKVA